MRLRKFEDMEKSLKILLNQVAFIKYNPWENSYRREENNIIILKKYTKIQTKTIILLIKKNFAYFKLINTNSDF